MVNEPPNRKAPNVAVQEIKESYRILCTETQSALPGAMFSGKSYYPGHLLLPVNSGFSRRKPMITEFELNMLAKTP